jgi:hypothetical protein
MAEERISHAQALDLIEEHLGEEVYVGFLVARADSGEIEPVDAVQGNLKNSLDPRPPRLEPDIGFYAIGRVSNNYCFAPMAGTVHLRDNGIDFRIADTALIRVAWRGSSEVGDWRPTREGLEKLNSIGVRLPEHEKPGVTLPSEAAE